MYLVPSQFPPFSPAIYFVELLLLPLLQMLRRTLISVSIWASSQLDHLCHWNIILKWILALENGIWSCTIHDILLSRYYVSKAVYGALEGKLCQLQQWRALGWDYFTCGGWMWWKVCVCFQTRCLRFRVAGVVSTIYFFPQHTLICYSNSGIGVTT
jgi:hypothetical protein